MLYENGTKQFEFHGTGAIFTVSSMFAYFSPKCAACIRTPILIYNP